MIMRLLNKLRRGPSCEEILEVLQSYLDGETDEETAKQVAVHLGECTECDRESQLYRRIKSSLISRRRPVDPEILNALHEFGDELIGKHSD
jgi:anti-sigma factor (TIGR02949 family)